LELVELRVAPGSKLDGLELYRLPSVCQAKVLVCAVEREIKFIYQRVTLHLRPRTGLTLWAQPERYIIF
jgi:Trk K+ transport system NAD-binding subunit